MLNSKFFPALLIALDILAAVGYGLENWRDWRHIVYWLSAAVLTYCVTF